jgi:hypothetical protein
MPLMLALAATLAGCGRQPPHQAAAHPCADKGELACLPRVAVRQPIDLDRLKANPPTATTTRLRDEKAPPHRLPVRAVHFITGKAKPASVTAKAEPAAAHIAPQPASSRTQLEPKSNVAAAESGRTGQPTVGFASNSDGRTIQQQVSAATIVAERMTSAALAAAGGNVESVETGSPSKTNPMIAIVMARPEIASLADLAGKNVALDERYSASSNEIWIAFVLAGVSSIEFSEAKTPAINRLVNREVTAALLAVVSADSAEAFPDIAGFKVFRVPLMRRSSSIRLKQ